MWWLDYSVRGARHRESSGTTSKSEAQRLLRRRLAEREAGKLVGRPERVTFRELRQGLERHYARAGNRSLRRARQALDHLERFFGAERRAIEITRPLVNAYIERRLAEGAARSTAIYEVRILGAALSVAVEEGLLAVRPTFRLPVIRNTRTGFFEDGDFAALLVELPAPVRPVVRFLRLTGWRKSEALGLTWDQVDWEAQVLRLDPAQTKGGDARVFPFGLAPELRQVLEEQWRARNGLFVFHRRGKPIRDFRRAWARACNKAGLAGRLVRDLRRTAARDFRRCGVSEGEIMKLCGWKTRAMFDRYNVIAEQDLAAAVARRFAAANGKHAANNPGVAPEPAPLTSSST
jgi:integrase